MALDRPNFAVSRPPNLSTWITDAEWWLWQRLQELEPTSELGGIAASKRGFHSSGQYNQQNHPGDYSIRDAINRTGPWWLTKCSALDWTFPEAHGGNYTRIQKYSARLDRATRDPNDPRPDLVLFEWYGQADFDTGVEGWNELRDEFASSDPSHLFHIHFSFLRNKCGDFPAMWALLTILMGWSVAQWRTSLEDDMAEFTPADPNAWAQAVRIDALRLGTVNLPAEAGGGTMWINDQIRALLVGQAASAQRETSLAAAISALTAMVQAGGGDVDAAAILARVDQRAAEVTALIEAKDAEIDALHSRLAAALQNS